MTRFYLEESVLLINEAGIIGSPAGNPNRRPLLHDIYRNKF